MSPLFVTSIPEFERPVVVSLLKDMRAALSYLSFYSPDSPFVSQAIFMFHGGLTRLLANHPTVVFQSVEGDLRVNGTVWEDTEVIARLMMLRDCPAFSVSHGASLEECVIFLKLLTTSDATHPPIQNVLEAYQAVPHFAWVSEDVLPEAPAAVEMVPAKEIAAVSAHSDRPVLTVEDLHNAPDIESTPDLKSMLVLVAEAWQLSRQVEQHLVDTPQARVFMTVYRRFFHHFLERLGTVSGEIEAIQGWFHCPEGEEVEAHMEDAMRELLSVAMEKGYTGVLYDPAAAGLVSECLAHWGAEGKHELLAKTVEALAKGLQGEPEERELALTHLMDSRPWVSNVHLVGVILDRLTAQLSEETVPGLYQKGLLISWDLLEPAMEAGLENQVLGLLSTLHLHADDEAPTFKERPALVRQWILGKSRPDLVRELVRLAHRHRRLAHYPLLSTIAATLLLDDFYAAGPEEIPSFLRLFTEMREQVRVALMERLPSSAEEMEVRLLLLIVNTCGIDPALSLQISAWMAKGSKELKNSILNTIEEVGDPGGGPALRLALLDDDETIAMEATRILSKIGFKPAVPLMMKAIKIRKDHGKAYEMFQAAVCKALGVFGIPETLQYLSEQTKKKNLFGGGAPLSVREAAVRAMAHFPQPGVAEFLDTLSGEDEVILRRAIDDERAAMMTVTTPTE
jgi:hypothetical protein